MMKTCTGGGAVNPYFAYARKRFIQKMSFLSWLFSLFFIVHFQLEGLGKLEAKIVGNFKGFFADLFLCFTEKIIISPLVSKAVI